MDAAATSLFAPGTWPSFVLISARISGLMMLSPFWSMVSIPRPTKGAFIVVLAAILTPLAGVVPFPDRVLSIPMPLMMEFTIGLVIGLTAAVIAHALMLASEVISMQTGLSLGQVLTPNLETGGPALSQLYWLLGLAVFIGIDGPMVMLEALARSIVDYPPGASISFAEGPMAVLDLTGSVFRYAIQICAPVMVALTLANILMAILSRAVPQLNAMAMAFGVTLSIGLLMIGLSLSLTVRALAKWYQASIGSVDGLLNLMIRSGVQ
ncbi:MAG: flagellar biosynthetic protein FliR [Gemmatimonadales bacterium]